MIRINVLTFLNYRTDTNGSRVARRVATESARSLILELLVSRQVKEASCLFSNLSAPDAQPLSIL
jgi:hypothetical protein